MVFDFKIENPKRNVQDSVGRASWYPFYAGFSTNFAYSFLSSAGLNEKSCILDPWNGGGTTTTTALSLGLYAQGYDLNPVMVVIAKARMLSSQIKNSLWPIAANIISKSQKEEPFRFYGYTPLKDPLGTWFHSEAVRNIRKVERCIKVLLIDESGHQDLRDENNINQLSDLASFFYTALFRSVRSFLRPFFSSNPTWIKKPTRNDNKLSVNLSHFLRIFEKEIRYMISSIDQDLFDTSFRSGKAEIAIASSQSLPARDNSVHFVLSSPPYCTRIDYAIATMPELAVLGYSLESDFQQLRHTLIGTSTVPRSVSTTLPAWGQTCNDFLQSIWSHKSKASSTYYYKNHFQYFDSIYKSLAQIQRVLVPNGRCVLVVQDSFYKDIHNNLPQIFIEMGDSLNLRLNHCYNFSSKRTLAKVNPGRRTYRKEINTTESIICLIKEEKNGRNY